MPASALPAARSLCCALFAGAALVSCGGGGTEAPPVVLNQAPQVTSSPPTTGSVGSDYAYDADATDPEGTALRYALAEAPAGMAIDTTSGRIAWTPSAAQVGNHAVVIQVTDTGGLGATQSFSIAVQPANGAPRLTATPPAIAVVDMAYRHELGATDPEGGALVYQLVQGPAGMALDPTTGALTWTPTAAQAGEHAVAVRVVDGGGLAAEWAFALQVSVGNAPPQITSTPTAGAVVGSPYSYALRSVDPNGDTLVHALAQAPSGATIDPASGLVAWTPTAQQAGSQTFTVRATDPGGLVATQTFSVSVAATANGAPLISSAPVTTAVTGTPYGYLVVASDPNGDTLAYSLVQAPPGMAIQAGTGLVTWTPSSAQAGVQAVAVRVADAAGLSATQSFSIAVAVPNAAPQIVSTPPAAALVGSAYSYRVGASDPNGDALTFTLSQAPAGMAIDATTGAIAWTPASGQTGLQPVVVRVTDPGGLAATQSFAIVVTVPNVAPVILSSPVVTAIAGAAYTYDVDAADANGDTLTHALVQAPAGMSIQAASGLITWSPTYAQVGRLAVVVRVSDAGGLAATQSFDIVVGGNPRIDLSTPATRTADAGGAVAITLNWVRVPTSSDTLQFMHLVNAGGQIWSVDDHWTTSATWTAGAFTETRTINVPPGLPAGTYDIRVGLSGGNPWGNFALATGTGVTDPAGDRRYRVGSITVTSRAPQITSTPVATAAIATAYVYDVNATDAEGDPFTFSLAQAPAGMTIDAASGLIQWTPTAGQLGAQAVTVRATDSGGFVGTQSFIVTVAAEPALGPMMMACADGAGWQCSGESVLRIDNGVALTRSGVQAYGRSTSDLLVPNPNLSSATGLALASGGVAEMRVRKDGNAAPVDAAMLLSNLAIYWSGQQNRPQIIETFNPTTGRVWLEGGVLRFGSLPPASDLSYYDYAYLGTAGTRGNYANNRYFPRAEPVRCVAGGWCQTYETNGLQFGAGSWRWGGSDPDWINGTRNHEDGDIHAGNGLPDANGNPTWLFGGTGFGVPMPGSKGYRTLDHWSYRYANLAAWFTQDTVNISEWGGIGEHNKNRRGFVAFGDTTDPATVPGGGTATYFGIARVRHTVNGSSDPALYTGQVTVVVNFASRTVTVSLQGTPVDMTTTSTLSGGANANYLQGTASGGGLSGGLGGRLFGPVTGGSSGTGPAEIGGVISLSNGNAVAVGGFIARLQ